MRHELIERRSLSLNRLVAEKIRNQPGLMDFVRSNLQSTLNDSVLSESCKDALREWNTLIETQSLDQVLNVLVDDSEHGRRLRQSTPFWGILTQTERLQIFGQYEPAGA